ncbi:PREDICTED: uncharacterized protein LOC101309247 [Fragaria vesca subsp. vesca]
MRTISWNYRGLGRTATVKALGEIISRQRPNILFLSETHKTTSYVEKIRRKMRFSQGFCVDPIGIAGDLCLWWDDSLLINIVDFSKNFLDTMITLVETGEVVRATFIYGPPYQEDKEDFWNEWSFRDKEDSTPWLVIGDLNELLSQQERIGDADWDYHRHRFLGSFINSNNLLDVGFSGPAFTWTRKAFGRIILQERLDRALVSAEWLVSWPNSSVTHLVRVGSDHCPILFSLGLKENRIGPGFKFESYWVDEVEIVPIVRACWGFDSSKSYIDNWNSNLTLCAAKLRQWHRTRFPVQVKEEIKDVLHELEEIQCSDPLANCVRQNELNAILGDLWEREEKYWHQRSRVAWLKARDSNT